MMVTPDELEHLVFMATHAPSVHNTQPWRFIATPDALTVERDRSRQAPVIDPWGRELLMSCGAAIDHLEVAARAIGIDTAIHLHMDGDIVADIEFSRGAVATPVEIARAVAILDRHTNRGRFSGPAVTEDALEAVRSDAQDHNSQIRVIHAADLTGVEVLLSRAEERLLRSPDYVSELDRWVWHGAVDPDRGDGLPQRAVEHGIDRAESLMGREFNGPVARPSEPPQAEEETVLLVTTATDVREDWIQAGRALSAILLTLTMESLVAQPLGQVVDLPGPRKALSDLLGVIGFPQMLLRIGHGASFHVTPRRSIDDVLTSLPQPAAHA